MTPQEAAQKIKAGTAVLIDVRELDEVQEGMAEQASWFSMYEMEEGNPTYEKFLSTLDKTKEVILYCRSGRRSGLAAQTLTEKGFKATNLGGFEGWTDAGLPTRTGP